MADMLLVTKSGCSPEQDELKFKISTERVEKYIKDELRKLINAPNSELADLDLSKVEIRSTKQGKRYYPFLIVLPYDQACYGKSDKNDGKNTNPFFDSSSTYMSKAPLKNQLRNFLGTDRNERFMYTSEDRNVLRTPRWRRDAGVDEGRGLRDIITLTEPRHYQFTPDKNGPAVHVVKVLLDPLRVLHDMVAPKGGSDKPFRLDSFEFKKLNRGLYMYEFTRREINNKGNRRKGNEDFEMMKIN